MNWTIYALIDPRSGEVRYVGWTSNLPRRLREHCAPKDREKAYKDNWLRELKSNGMVPGCEVLETGTGESYGAAERKWIAFYREASPRLTNLTDGGDGAPRHIKSAETRRKSSLALTGRSRPREVIEKVIATKRLRGQSPQQIEALRLVSAANVGRRQPRSAVEHRANLLRGKSWGTHTDAERERISMRFKGVPKSPETRAKMSAARKGYKPSAKSVQKMRETKLRKNAERRLSPGDDRSATCN